MRVEDRSGDRVRVTVAGRVNLIGDHTDYMGGLALPLAINLFTTLEATVGGDRIELRSDVDTGHASIALPVRDPGTEATGWARYPAAVAAELGTTVGIGGEIHSTIPVGAGLSSSASLELAVALALGAQGSAVELARVCRQAEALATGVPCGIMDQLCIASARSGHAGLIDCAAETVEQVAIPPDMAIWVLHSGQTRTLEGSAYGQRRRAAEAAASLLGPLPTADPDAIEALADPILRRRARHVRSECLRVLECASAIVADDPVTAGRLMNESHASLRDDYEVSTPLIDALAADLVGLDGVHGARITGAGFGGCVVALAEPGLDLGEVDPGRWRVVPSDGVRVEVDRADGPSGTRTRRR